VRVLFKNAWSSSYSSKEDYATFRRVYEVPILKSRAPDCSAKENEIGKSRSEQVRI
jgi:hypothetical protein